MNTGSDKLARTPKAFSGQMAKSRAKKKQDSSEVAGDGSRAKRRKTSATQAATSTTPAYGGSWACVSSFASFSGFIA